jgi:hypothetical protein
MAHAVVIQVKLDPNSDIEHRHSILNDFVVPEAKALPGFKKGIWMNDGAGTGTCVIVLIGRLRLLGAAPTSTRGGTRWVHCEASSRLPSLWLLPC